MLPGAVQALLALPVIPQSLTLCTDDVFPDDLVAEGGMLALLRRLIAHGLPPVQALRAATLNAATRIGHRDLGLVAPGRRADFFVASDLEQLEIRDVFASGRQVARDGEICIDINAGPTALPAPAMHVPPLRQDQFRLTVSGSATRVRVRTVDKPRFTEWGEMELEVRNGAAVLPAEATLMAVIHRHGRAQAVPALDVLRNWGSWRGALATSVLHDSHNLAAFGHDPEDMALAANAVIAAQGGIAVSSGSELRAIVELPVCGLLSDAPTATVAAQFRALRAAAEPLARLVATLSRAEGGVRCEFGLQSRPARDRPRHRRWRDRRGVRERAATGSGGLIPPRRPAARLWSQASRRPADDLAGSVEGARTPDASTSIRSTCVRSVVFPTALDQCSHSIAASCCFCLCCGDPRVVSLSLLGRKPRKYAV